jgi:hypothetical protein
MADEYEVKATPDGSSALLTTSVSTWSFGQRLRKVLELSLPLLGPDAVDEIVQMLNPKALGIMAGVLVAWLVSHAFGLGEIIDAILTAVGAIALGLSIFSAIDHLYDFASWTYKASNLAELQIAAAHLAKAIAIIGIQAVLAIIFRGAKRPKTYKDPVPPMRPKPPAQGWFYKPKITAVPNRPAGFGVTSAWGDIEVSSLGSATDKALVLLHEKVHQFFAPKLDILRTYRAGNLTKSYVGSSLYRYIEEALAETMAQVGVQGFRHFFEGVRFPLRNRYMYFVKGGGYRSSWLGEGLLREAAGLVHSGVVLGFAYDLYLTPPSSSNVDVSTIDDDDTIRQWVDAHDEDDILALNVRVKLRLLNALLDGWVSDEDLDAFQIICGAVTTHHEGNYLKEQLDKRSTELTDFSQRTRMRAILGQLP